MTCRAVRKSLPLLAGDDLGPRKAAKVRAHLAVCATCRLEAATYAAARKAVRTLAREDQPPAWTEVEWSSAVRIATGASPSRRKRAPALRLRPVLATGLAFAIAGAGTLAVLHKKPLPAPAAVLAENIRPPSAASALPALPKSTEPPGPVLRRPAGPHLTAITFDQKDGALKVVWFFNRDFKTDFYGK
jgi:hypothetical protein